MRSTVDRSSWPVTRLAFRARFATTDWKPEHRNVSIAALLFPTPSGTLRIFHLVSKSALHLAGSVPTFQSKLTSKPLPFDTWVALRVEVSALNGTSVRTKVPLDEAAILDVE